MKETEWFPDGTVCHRNVSCYLLLNEHASLFPCLGMFEFYGPDGQASEPWRKLSKVKDA